MASLRVFPRVASASTVSCFWVGRSDAHLGELLCGNCGKMGWEIKDRVCVAASLRVCEEVWRSVCMGGCRSASSSRLVLFGDRGGRSSFIDESGTNRLCYF